MNNHQKNVLIAAIALFALLFTLFSLTAASEMKRSVSARAATLYEPTNREFLYTKSENERLPMASTTKIMTALVALRECEDLTVEVTVDERAVGIEGSSAYFKGGEVYTLFDLLHIMMLRSANDAACQIALTVSGEISEFAALMNDTAVALGLRDSNFTNPSGLDDENHYTTAHDLAVITAEALKYPAFRDIVSKKSYEATELTSGKSGLYVNHNKLLASYDGCIGVKTGYTKKSGRSLVSAAERDGVMLIAVTINAPDDWSDHKALLDYGFSTLEYCEPLKRADTKISVPVVNSRVSEITASPESDFSLIKRKSEEIKLVYDFPNYLVAPIKKGESIGRIRLLKNGKCIAEIPILADTDAEKIKTFFEKITFR